MNEPDGISTVCGGERWRTSCVDLFITSMRNPLTYKARWASRAVPRCSDSEEFWKFWNASEHLLVLFLRAHSRLLPVNHEVITAGATYQWIGNPASPES